MIAAIVTLIVCIHLGLGWWSAAVAFVALVLSPEDMRRAAYNRRGR